MRKALGCTLLSATLAGGVVLPAQAVPATDATTGGAPVTQSAATLTPEAAAAQRPVLAAGQRSPAVVFVQRALGVTPTSGYFGPLTQAAVRAWQQKSGLPVTGVVDAAAWTMLLAAAPGRLTASAATLTPEAAAAARPVLGFGARTPAVVYVQRKLGVAPATGYYGTLTRNAVTRLQRQKGLTVTGTVTAATWKLLLTEQSGTPPTSSPSPTPTPKPTQTTKPTTPAPTPKPPAPAPLTPEQAAAARPGLAQGMSGPAVVYVQRFLKVTPTSGYFGPLTRAAVVAYQTGLGLSTSGSVEATTWEAILAGRIVPTAPAPSGPTTGPTPSPATIKTPIYRLPATPAARDHALVFALAQVGKPYVLGGNGPAVFDCSGLVQQAYLTAGVKLPRRASQQRFAGVEVTLDQVQPGDLLYYQSGSSPRSGHISMYAGDGLVVEAANPRRGVRIRTLHEKWYRDRFVAAIRIG